MRFYVSLLMALSLAQLVEARLGKTIVECDTLYGASLLSKTRTDGNILIKTYGNESVVVSCRFFNDVCFELGVSNLDEQGQVKSLSPERVAGLFLKNFGNIPKVNPQATNIGANTVEHTLGSDGRYVWREEQTTTGVITVLRDNTLAPSVTTNSKKKILLPQETDTDFLYITKNDTLELARLRLSGKPSSVYVLSKAKNDFESWKKASESGAPEGQHLYGLCLSFGCMVSSNETTAVSWFRKAAEQGYAPAQHSLGTCFGNGRGVEKDDIEAFSWYRKAAESGYALAQNSLASSYARGRGVAKSETEAFAWCRKAAEQGYAPAQFNLGRCYETGQGVLKDNSEALRWYRKAAEQGDPDHQIYLGLTYSTGRLYSEDKKEAFIWYCKAAMQGNPEAQYLLGDLYSRGEGVAKNDVEAVNWFQKSAESGRVDAQVSLAAIYLREEDVFSAARWYRKAASQNSPAAQYSLAELYQTGRGVTQNTTEAINLYKKAADQGYVLAMSKLSDIYSSGSIAPKNPSEAFKWCRDAAIKGSSNDQFNLAIMYLKGYATAQDYSQSYSWLLKCVENPENDVLELSVFRDMSCLILSDFHERGLGVSANGSKATAWRNKIKVENEVFTITFLGTFFLTCNYPKPDYKEAFKWQLIAANKGNKTCQLYVGCMYEIGCGTEIDIAEASKWFSRAEAGGVNVAEKKRIVLESLTKATN